jgi:hypothetical protein
MFGYMGRSPTALRTCDQVMDGGAEVVADRVCGGAGGGRQRGGPAP